MGESVELWSVWELAFNVYNAASDRCWDRSMGFSGFLGLVLDRIFIA